MFKFIFNNIICFLIIFNINFLIKEDNKKYRKYLKHYFVCISLILAADNVFSSLLEKIPFYSFFKLSLILCISVPNSSGVHFLYNVYVKTLNKALNEKLEKLMFLLNKVFILIRNKYNNIAFNKKILLKDEKKIIKNLHQAENKINKI